MSTIFAIDPGPEESAYAIYDAGRKVVEGFFKKSNDDILRDLNFANSAMTLVIEKVASFGMPVGAEVFETCVWSGRFIDRWDCRCGNFDRITRMEVKMALCHDSRAKDPHIRQALIDLFGGKDKAIGTKKNPGMLYGCSGDCWSALAVAVAYAGREKRTEAA